MIIEVKSEVNEDHLNNFISERESEIRDGKNDVVAKLQKKATRMCKRETNTDQEKEELERKANYFTKVAMFLRKYPPNKLMAMALLDKKSLTNIYNSPLSKVKQRALFHFASHESIKTLILKFRKQYPNWKEAKGLLLKMKENKNHILCELTNTIGTDENGNKSKKLKKKKAGKKSLKRIKEMNEDGSDNESCEMPQNKKVKVSSDNNLSKTEDMINSKSGEEEEKIGAPKYMPRHIKKKQKKMKKKKMKMSPIEKTLHNDSTNPDVSISSPTGTSESMVDAEPSLVQQSPSKRWQEGKFHRKSNKKQGLENGSRKNRSQPMWKKKKSGRKDNANMIVSPDGKDKSTSLKKDDGEKQDKSTSPKKDDGEKQDKSTSPKKDDGEKPSLLRPVWLTNPQEYKPEPACNGQRGRAAPAFNRQRGRSGPGGNRQRGRPGPPGNRGFQRKDPNSANMIHVSDDWKSKCAEPKTEDTKTTSLLRPSWLINPQEYTPPPSFKKFRGNFRGRNK